MQMVHQIGDQIWVRTADDRHYGEPSNNFAEDYGSPAPKLPPGITSREYEPGIRHALKVGTDVVDGGPMPWPEGDKILKAANQLWERKEKREANLAEENRARIEAELKEMQEKMEKEIEERKQAPDEAIRQAMTETKRGRKSKE